MTEIGSPLGRDQACIWVQQGNRKGQEMDMNTEQDSQALTNNCQCGVTCWEWDSQEGRVPLAACKVGRVCRLQEKEDAK